MKYVYIIDTKLVSYYLVQRHRSLSDIFNKMSDILSYLKKKGGVYLAFDIGHSDFRMAEQSYYKGHRRINKAKESQAAQLAHKEFNKQYARLPEMMKHLNVKVLAIKGVEADDLASIVCKMYEPDPNVKVTLISGDMDWCHMVVEDSSTRIYDFTKDLFLYQKDVREMYDLKTRRDFSVLKSLAGDYSDNIKCITQLAKTRGKELFDDIRKKYNNEATDEEVMAELLSLVDSNDKFKVHPFHIDDGRTTPSEAYISNMKIADPFTLPEQMTPEQQKVYADIMATPFNETLTTYQDFFDMSVDLFGFPLQLTDASKKIYGVE